MALTHFGFELLQRVIGTKQIRPLEMATMGYPDCMITESKLISLFGPQVLSGLEYREDSAEIARWHSVSEQCQRVPESVSLFRKLGINLTVFDIAEIRGGEIICDLNQPVTSELHGKFDIVLDAGTMEHCFNVGQVIKNFLAMANEGGMIVHINPCFVINHGFFNFSPTFYHDFYVDNGHHLETPITGFVNLGLDYKAFELKPFKRAHGVPERSWVSVVAQKKHANPPFWPTQTKYKQS